MSKQGYVYIISNQRKTVLYTGVTSNLEKRIFEYKNRVIKGFSSRYNCECLLWYECTDEMLSAIQREKQIKAGSRKKKEELISELNPSWEDLAKDWF